MKKFKRIFAVLLCLSLVVQFLPINALRAAAEGPSISMKNKGALAPEEAFDMFEISTKSHSDGKNPSFQLDFAFNLNNEHLSKYGDAYLTALLEGEDPIAPDQFDEHFSRETDEAKLPSITFTLPMTLNLADELAGTMADIPASGVLTTQKGEQLGTYTTAYVDGVLTIIGTLDKFIYNSRQDVSAGGSVLLSFSTEKEGDINAGVNEKDNEVVIDVDFVPKDVEPEPEEKEYSLTKTAQPRSDKSDPFITYDITAKATGDNADLSGLIIRDVIPAGLDVIEVLYNNEPQAFSIDEDTLNFVIPAGADGAPVESAALTIRTSVSSAVYADLLKTPGSTSEGSIISVKKEFENTASLHLADEEDPLVVSDKVADEFFVQLLEKKSVHASGGLYNWTVTANTSFAAKGSGQVYLVDTIDDNHNYIFEGDALQFSVEGAAKTAAPAASTLTYDELTVAALDALTDGGANPVYYKVGSNTVLIVPLTQEELTPSPAVLTYQTKVTETSGEATGGFDTKNLTNKVKMLGKWNFTGTQPGPGEDPGEGGDDYEFNFDVTKNVEAKYAPLRKKAASYNAETQIMQWNFSVNEWGKDLSEVVVTDVLNDRIQQFVSLTTKNGEIPLGKAGDPTPYYTLASNTPEANQTTLQIHLGDIPASSLVEFSLKTKVVNPDFLSQQKNVTLKNEATIAGKVDGTPISAKTSAERSLSNTLLKKVQKGYAPDTHKVKWEITANHNYLSILDAVLTESLPEGNTFDALEKVTRYVAGNPEAQTGTISGSTVTFADGLTITLDKIEEGISKDGFSQDTAVFSFHAATPNKAVSDKFVLAFSTSVDQDYRDQKFVSSKQLSLENKVKLSGKIADPTAPDDAEKFVQVDASATANQKITPAPVQKTGVYQEPTAAWRIVINRDKIDLTDAVLTDVLKPHFELDLDSVAVYEAEIDAKGDAVVKPDAQPITQGMEKTLSGFTFSVPAEYAKTPLVITFQTNLIASVQKEDIKNTATLTWKNNTGGESNGGEAKNSNHFNVDNYAEITKTPYLNVLKTSQHSNTVNGNPAFRLAGAEFTLTPMQNEDGNWTADESLGRVRVTSTSGNAYFFFLRPDTLYRLEETKAPSGYERSTDTQYYVFQSKDSEQPYPENTSVIAPNQPKFATTIIPNTPKNTDNTNNYTFSFDKKTDNGTALSGVSFLLRDPSGKIKDQTAISNASGKVVFAEVDPGTYQLTETTPAGFEAIAPITVTVQWNGEAFTLNMQGAAVTSLEGGGFVVTNGYSRGDVQLTKTDSTQQEAAQPMLLAASQPSPYLSGAEFSVYKTSPGGEDHLVAYLTEAPTLTGTYLLANQNAKGETAPVLKNTLGDPLLHKTAENQFLLLTGDYYLVETTTPAGYLPDTDQAGALKKHTFTVAANKTTFVTNNEAGTSFTNEPYGKIQGVKQTSSKNPLANAVIGLFPEGTTKFTEDTLFESRTATSETDGTFLFDKVPYGTYIVAELKAPSGYYLNTKTFFTVAVKQNVEIITADQSGAPILIENTRRPSSPSQDATLSIHKTSEDGLLEGFTFIVRGEGGYSREFVTNQKGVIIINDLPVGDYTVEEKATALTTDRYVLPAGQSITLTLSGAKLNFYNKLIPDVPPVEIEDPDVPTGPLDPPTDPQGPTDPQNPTDPEIEIEEPGVPTGPLNPPTAPNRPFSPEDGEDIYGPRTGDSSANGIWVAVLLVSAFGLTGSIALLRRDAKKRKEQ